MPAMEHAHMDHSKMDHTGHMDHGGGGMDDMCSMSVRFSYTPTHIVFCLLNVEVIN